VASFIYRRKLTIEWGQCDPAGIVFNSRFFEIFDASTWQMFEAALGVKPHELANAFGIIGIPLVDAGANFLRPIKFGDIVDMTSRVSEFRRSSFDVEHRLTANWQSRAAKPGSGRRAARIIRKRSAGPPSPAR
jgi:4-hydroxybenzoyl-CoA thioesterase